LSFIPPLRLGLQRFLDPVGLAAGAQPRETAGDEADDALRQEQRRGDEQRAEREQPEFREGRGEIALAAIDRDGADDRPDQRAAPADRVQMTTSMELAGANSPGLMMPTCGT
jgi:hypothetical protein